MAINNGDKIMKKLGKCGFCPDKAAIEANYRNEDKSKDVVLALCKDCLSITLQVMGRLIAHNAKEHPQERGII